MAVNPKKYHSIHKVFNRVKFDYVAIQIEIMIWIVKFFKLVKVSISIDDSIVYRSRKKKVPYGHKQFDHANKANRSNYVFGQKWLAFGLIMSVGTKSITLPLFIYLVQPQKNLITTTVVILGKIRRVMKRRGLHLEVEILTDSWFAKQRLIVRATQRYQFSIITMARKDLALYKLPPVKRKGTRGRPRKKGKRIQPKLEDLKKETTLYLYGREVEVRYKQAIAKAKFLNYESIKAVWVEFDNNSSLRLIISTDTTLKAQEIIKRYAKRWDIEPMFDELKNRFKFKEIMMHSTHSYYQFLYFKIWCFIIIKLSSIEFSHSVTQYIKEMLPWRVHYKKGVSVTAGSTQLALKNIFTTLHIELFFPKVDKNTQSKSNKCEHYATGLDIFYEEAG